MENKSLLRRLAAGAAVLAVTGATLLGGASAAQAQPPVPPSGPIYFDPTSGIEHTIISGTTAGPCDQVGADGTVPNALQVYVTGPSKFAPDPVNAPYGVAFTAATQFGFSTTQPNTFAARVSFKEMALELGLSEVPVGDYVVDFRCVDELFIDRVYQTYTGTITFTTPTSFTAPGAPTPTPVPAA